MAKPEGVRIERPDGSVVPCELDHRGYDEVEDMDNWDIVTLPDPDTPAIRPPRVDLKRWAEEFRDVYRIAEALCKTPFVPKEMIGRQADVAAAIMKGQELGLDPFDALGSIYIV